MRKSANNIFSFLLAAVLVTSAASPVMARESITREYTYTSENADEKSSGQFGEEISQDGKKYTLKDIRYEINSEEPVYEDVEVTKKIVSDPVGEDESYVPKETVTENDVIYALDKTTKKSVILEKAYTLSASCHTDYTSKSEADAAPETKFTSPFIDKKTGELVRVECSYTGQEIIRSDDWEDTYIDIKFISYNAEEFVWNGITVKKDEDTPLKGYETQLLESVGGTADNYRIVKIYWNGNAYTDKNGILCRDARADVQRKINYYRVNYSGSRKIGAVKGHVYTSTYKGTLKKDTGRKLYTITATATYEEGTGPGVKAVIVGMSVGILLLIIFAVGTLFILKKKKEKGTEIK